MINISLKQMRYFEALARHAHFGHAAEACSISQPALSMQIKELEETLGAPLFERSARSVRLSRFGEAVAGRIRPILRAVDELDEFSRAAQGGALDRLRIGVIPTIAPYLLPRLIPRLKQTYAGIDISVRETLTERLVQELHDGRLDAAIVALPLSEPAFSEITLFEEGFVLVRPQADAGKQPPPLAELPRHKLLLLEEGHCFRDQALNFCDIRPNEPQDSLEGSSLSTLVQMVGAGLGVTLIPEMAVPVETRSADVCVTTFPGPHPGRTVGMVWRKTSTLAETFTGLAQIVRESALSLPTDSSARAG
jgi:LysR family hydrogen peroxide-inducible transcriptional activator